MKIISFSCTIEVSRDANGYSNNYYVDIDDKGVSVSHPYIKQSTEQVQLVHNIINEFIDKFNDINRRVDRFNFDNHLEQYAPKVPESTAESIAESAVPQVAAGGSDSTDSIREVSLVEEKALEEAETASDKA